MCPLVFHGGGGGSRRVITCLLTKQGEGEVKEITMMSNRISVLITRTKAEMAAGQATFSV